MAESAFSDNSRNEEIRNWLHNQPAFLDQMSSPYHLQPLVDMLRSHVDAAVDAIRQNSEKSNAEWYYKVQLQSLLFNMGIILSLHCATRHYLNSQSSDALSKIQSDVMSLLTGRDITSWRRPLPVTYALVFLQTFLRDIRDQICSSSHKSVKLATGGVSATSLANWLTAKIGFHDPFATAMAASLLIFISTSAHGAFCSMTDAEYMEKLRKEGL